MAGRKITDEMIDRIAQWDLQGWSLRAMAAELPVSKEVVRRNLLKIRKARREYRNVKESHFLHQLDILKAEAWAASRRPVVTTREGKDGTTTITTMPPIAAMRIVLDILREQTRLLGMGSGKPEQQGDVRDAPNVVNVIIKDRKELAEGMSRMSLGLFKSRLLPDQPRNGE